MKYGFFRRLGTFALAVALMIPFGAFNVRADSDGTITVPVDSVNGTRWADIIVVYKDRPTTLQNEWGWNVVVSADGVVIDKIPGGDARGTNLAVPEGGFVLSGTGEAGENMYEAVNIDDNAVFDEYGMRVLISGGDIDPFYKTGFTFTGRNAPRYSNTLIIYDISGTHTETNGYGFEVCVNSDGFIISAGGNDSVVPDGGFVISAIEPADKNLLKAYCIPGAKCVISGNTVTVSYDESMMAATVENELRELEKEVQTAKSQLRLVDYDAISERIAKIDPEDVFDLESRDSVIDEIKSISRMLIEQREVEVRSVWYVPLEKSQKAVYKTVEAMKEAGINQLCLGIVNDGKSIVRVPDMKIYKADSRSYHFDILQTYVSACKEQGIELVASIPVFFGGDGAACTPYLTLTNGGEINAEHFASPANDEFFEEITEYFSYIATHYAIDGIQYDYIRYPYFDGTTDFGYDDASKKLFTAETGLGADVIDGIAKQLRAHENWNDWVNFKTSLIDRRVAELSEKIRSLRPDIYISAAVANDTGADFYCQDSSQWLAAGSVDGIYPMSYSAGIFPEATKKFGSYMTDSSYLIMGNGAYMSLSLDEMYRQFNEQAIFGGDGIAFFEWGAYVDHGYAAAFEKDVMSKPALSFTYAESASIEALRLMAAARLELYFAESGKTGDTLDTDMSLDEMNTVLAAYGNDYLTQDIELALRIEKMSKEDKKGGNYLVSESSDEPSSEASAGASEDGEESGASVTDSDASASSDSGEAGKGNVLPWLIGGVLAVAAVAVVVIFGRKKK